MWDKTWMEASRIDVTPHVKQRDGQDYLPWAKCKLLLHNNGADRVDFSPVPAEDGSSLHQTAIVFRDKNGVENRCYEVKVQITVDSETWTVCYPVLNGNSPVKDNSMSQLRVANAIRRAFVKGVAEHLGLGFSLWLDDDDIPQEVDDLSKHSLLKCRQRMEELITAKIKQGIPLSIMAERLGKDEDELRGMLGWYKTLARCEKMIWEMTP